VLKSSKFQSRFGLFNLKLPIFNKGVTVMGIEWFRDLSITVMGFTATAVLIFVAVIAYRLYRSATSVLQSIRAVSQTINDAVTLVQESIKPMIWITALIQSIRGGFEAISQMFKKESNEGGSSNE
jgi:hypothetical protein